MFQSRENRVGFVGTEAMFSSSGKFRFLCVPKPGTWGKRASGKRWADGICTAVYRWFYPAYYCGLPIVFVCVSEAFAYKLTLIRFRRLYA
jgi:hypothetical protein